MRHERRMKRWRVVSSQARTWAAESAASEFISREAKTALDVVIINLTVPVANGSLPKPRFHIGRSDDQIRITSSHGWKHFSLTFRADEDDWVVECFVHAGEQQVFASDAIHDMRYVGKAISHATAVFTKGPYS